MAEHPITPPSDLINQWYLAWDGKASFEHCLLEAARWGADQELEACCEIAVSDPVCGTKHQRSMLVKHIKERRRPKPPTLKEQALRAARIELSQNGRNAALIIRALDALPDD